MHEFNELYCNQFKSHARFARHRITRLSKLALLVQYLIPDEEIIINLIVYVIDHTSVYEVAVQQGTDN